MAARNPPSTSVHAKATIDSVRVSLGGLHLSQIAVGLLGVLAVTSEYSSGRSGPGRPAQADRLNRTPELPRREE
jgi:hypothetical protein